MKNRILILTLVCLANVAFAQTVLNVPSEYATIQAALDVADSSTVISVAPGTYKENLIWPSKIDDIKLIGQAGSEQTFLEGADSTAVITINAFAPSSGSPQFISRKTLVQGFTIQNTASNDSQGAGIVSRECSPNFQDLVFKNNSCISARCSGGSMALSDYGGVIDNCRFIDNAVVAGSIADAAAIFMIIRSDSTQITNCVFENNTVKSNSQVGFGGAIFVHAPEFKRTALTIENCDFIGNSITGNSVRGGAIHFGGQGTAQINIDSCVFENNFSSGWGGAIYGFSHNYDISNTTFINNIAPSGSVFGMQVGSNDQPEINFEQVVFRNNAAIDSMQSVKSIIESIQGTSRFSFTNCVMDHNEVPFLNIENFRNKASVNLTHCTMAFNAEGIGSYENTDITAQNSIFWNEGISEFSSPALAPESSISLTNCLVKGGHTGTNIIEDDPAFEDEFNLLPTLSSPCIAGGDLMFSSAIDITGDRRPRPSNTFPDLGAYEVNQDPTSTNNLDNGDELVFYPNPASLKITFIETPDKIRIFNSTGQLIESYTNRKHIDISTLSSGIYFVEIQEKEHILGTKLLMVR